MSIKNIKNGFYSLGVYYLLGQSITLLMLPILTRIYSVDDVGRWGLFLAFSNLLSPISCLCYELAIVNLTNPHEIKTMLIICHTLSVMTAITFTGLFFIFKKFSLYGFAHFDFWTLPIFFLSLLFSSTYQIFRYHQLRDKNYKTLGKILNQQNLIRTITQLLLGLAKCNYLGLLIGDVLGKIFGLCRYVSTLFKTLIFKKEPCYQENFFLLLRKYCNFPRYSLPSTLINSLAFALPIPLIIQFYGLTDAGIYTLANRLLSIPNLLVTRTLADVFHSESADLQRKKPLEVKPLFYKTAGILSILGFTLYSLVVISMILSADRLFSKQWHDIGMMTAALVPWSLMQFIVSPLSRIILVTGKQSLKLIYDVFAICGITIGISIGKILGFSFFDAMIFMSILGAMSYFLYFIILCFALKTPQWQTS